MLLKEAWAKYPDKLGYLLEKIKPSKGEDLGYPHDNIGVFHI
jgi:hypothetical protein